jgi:hypothetical protein
MTTWDNVELVGTATGGWQYNDANLTYNATIDPDSGISPVLYNGIGTTTSWGNQTLLTLLILLTTTLWQ